MSDSLSFQRVNEQCFFNHLIHANHYLSLRSTQRVHQRLVGHRIPTRRHGRILLMMLPPDRVDSRGTSQSGAHRGAHRGAKVSVEVHGITLEEKIPNHHPAHSVAAISHQVSSHPIHSNLQAVGSSHLAPVVSVLALTVAVMEAQLSRVSLAKHQLDRKFLQWICFRSILLCPRVQLYCLQHVTASTAPRIAKYFTRAFLRDQGILWSIPRWNIPHYHRLLPLLPCHTICLCPLTALSYRC
jgi:hypothetical protein